MSKRRTKFWWCGDRASPLGRRRGRRPEPACRVPLPSSPFAVTAFKPENLKPDLQRDAGLSPARIRCPLCSWQPSPSSRWHCMQMGPPENFSGGCGHSWNTFDTRGVCPGCTYQWRHTWCFGCHRPSPHDDWYVAPGKKRTP